MIKSATLFWGGRFFCSFPKEMLLKYAIAAIAWIIQACSCDVSKAPAATLVAGWPPVRMAHTADFIL